MSLLAKTTFSSGPLAQLLVTDGYKAKGNEILSSFQDIAAMADMDLSGILGGSAAGVMGDLVAKIGGNLAVSPQAMIQRLVSGNGALAGAFAQIENTIKGGMGIPKDLVDRAQATINGITTAISGADLTSLRGISSAINAINGSGNPFAAVFTDIGGMVGVVSSLVTDSSKLGMYGVLTSLAETIENPEILLQSLKNIIPTAIIEKDIRLLLDAANSAIGGSIGQLFPDVIDILMGGFKIPQDIFGNEIQSFLDDLLSGLDRIDSDWNGYTRYPGDSSLNGKRLLSSSAMRDMLYARNTKVHPFTYTISIVGGVVTVTRSLNNSDDEFMVLATSYAKETVAGALRRDFPNCKITTDPTTTPKRPIDAYTYANGNYLK